MSHDTLRRIAGIAALAAWPFLFAAAVAAMSSVHVPVAVVLLLAAAAISGTVGWLLFTAAPNLYDAWAQGVEYGQQHPPLKSQRTEQTVQLGGNVLGFRRR